MFLVARALAQGDFKALEKALRTIASKPVPGMDEWVTIATKGAEAAKAQDMAGARDSCKQCHQLYSDHYKKTMRDKPW